jgi:hypothetical protein
LAPGAKNHILSGVTLSSWLRILWRYGAVVEWTTYWPRLAFLFSISIFNSVVATLEWLTYRSWRQQARTSLMSMLMSAIYCGETLLSKPFLY